MRVRTSTFVALALLTASCTGTGRDRPISSTTQPHAHEHESEQRSDPRFWQRFGPDVPVSLQADDVSVVAVGMFGEVVEYRRQQDEVRWSVELDMQEVANRPAMSPRTVVVAGRDEVAAVDRGTGAVRWHVQLVGAGSVWFAGTFVVSVRHDELVGLDEDTGAVRWRLRLSRNFRVPHVDADGTTFCFVEGAAPAPALRAVDGVTGAVRWTQQLEGGASEAAVHEDRVVVVAGRAEAADVQLFDVRSGARLWRSRYPGRLPRGGLVPAIDNDAVAVVDGTDSMRMLDARTGAVRWRSHVGDAGGLPAALGLSRRWVLWPTYAGTLQFARGDGRKRSEPVFMGRLRAQVALGDVIAELVDVGGSGSVELRPG